jgi:hypothetical protein
LGLNIEEGKKNLTILSLKKERLSPGKIRMRTVSKKILIFLIIEKEIKLKNMVILELMIRKKK